MSVVSDLVKSLREKGATGADLSPGDPDCAFAARIIARLARLEDDARCLRERCGVGVQPRNQKDGYAMHGGLGSCVYCRAADAIEALLKVVLDR